MARHFYSIKIFSSYIYLNILEVEVLEFLWVFIIIILKFPIGFLIYTHSHTYIYSE